jgi:hypothetical protein
VFVICGLELLYLIASSVAYSIACVLAGALYFGAWWLGMLVVV